MRKIALAWWWVVVFALACGDDDASGGKSVTLRIGPQGGTVELSGVKVEIPADALDEPVDITIKELKESDVPELPFNLEVAGKPYAFRPHGLMFAMPVKIEVPYTGSDLDVRPMKLPNEDPTLDSSDWVTVFPHDKDDASKKVSMEAVSFSVYMAARPLRTTGVVTLPDGAIDDGGMPEAGGSGGDGGSAGTAGTSGSGGSAGMDAMVGPDAGLDAALGMDAGIDSGLVPDASAAPLITYLKGSHTTAGDQFGSRLAMDGNTLVVAAPANDGVTPAVSQSGSAYVFVHDGNGWTEQAFLRASNAGVSDSFASSVAISGDTIVIGAGPEDSNAAGVDGNQADDSATNSGAAYVFERSGTTWTQVAYLKASNTRASALFGTSVAISGTLIVVGSPGESSAATQVDGDQLDTTAAGAGAAYVFERIGGVWGQVAYLKAENAGADDNFGISVGVSADRVIVVGANQEDSANDLSPNDNTASNSGAAYLFEPSGPSWVQVEYLKASYPGANDIFGTQVAIDGVVVAVSAPAEDSWFTGNGPEQADEGAPSSGAVYVWGNDEGSWRRTVFLKASNTNTQDQFGRGLALHGDVLVVGAWNEASAALGIDGDQTDNTAANAGAAYVFRGVPQQSCCHPYATWTQQAYLKASNTEAADLFGSAVAVGDSAVVVGAAAEDSNATTINGSLFNNGSAFAGAAYAYPIAQPVFVEVCGNGEDDDGDENIDCSDSDCLSHTSCL